MAGDCSRRTFTGLVAAVAALHGARVAGAAADPTRLAGVEAAAALADGRVSARELADACLDRAARLAELNAFITLDAGAVRRQAEAADRRRAEGGDAGPLAGVPLAVKDNIDTASLPTTAGTPALRDWRPAADAIVLSRLRDAGATLFGKTNMHELAFGITSNNVAFGPVRNPWHSAMIPGGSSGGSAAAVAARIVPWALGTDTGGSCRIPAALCGCCGFRPSLGRYPQQGVVPLSHSRDTVGLLARRVADLVLLDALASGEAAPTPPAQAERFRIGLARRFFFENLDPELETVVDQTVATLAAAGIAMVDVDLSAAPEASAAVGFPLVLFEVLRELALYLAGHGSRMSVLELVDGVAGRSERALLRGLLGEGAVPAEVYREALVAGRPRLQKVYAALFAARGVDAVLVPTTPLPARPIGEEAEVELRGAKVPTFPTYIRHTDPPSVAGLPAVSIPAGLTASGLPVGIELVGGVGQDRRLLAIAAAVERVLKPLPELD